MNQLTAQATAVRLSRWWRAQRLTDRQMQLLWLIYALLACSVVIVGVPLVFARLQTPCDGLTCLESQLTAENIANLESTGISIRSFAVFTLGLSLTIVAVTFTFAAILIGLRPNDRMARVFAFVWIALGASISLAPDVLALHYPLLVGVSRLFWFIQAAALVPGFLAFPDGRFVPGWTRWLALFFITMDFIQIIIIPGFGLQPADNGVWQQINEVRIPLAFMTLVVAQIYRYRYVSNTLQKQQTKWVIFGIALILCVMSGVVGFHFLIPNADQPGSIGYITSQTIAVTGILLGLLTQAFAILRYRLFDIDLILNRTLVYATLTAFVIGVYGLIVGGAGMLFQSQAVMPILSVSATGLIALLFQPLHERVQRGVNRLFFGQRDEPYQVLTRLGEQLRSTLSGEAILPTIAETVGRALKLPLVEIGVNTPHAALTSNQWRAEPAWNDEHTTLLTFPLTYQAQQIGTLRVSPRHGESTLSARDRRLLTDLTDQAGIAVHGVQVMAELAEARRRVVNEREEARRRLGNDLHDGVGHQLAATLRKAESAANLLDREPQAAHTLLAEVTAQLHATIQQVRHLAHQLHPPELGLLGLVEALGEKVTQAQGAAGLQITFAAPQALPPLPVAVETAAYYITLEALSNVQSHAQARTCQIVLRLLAAPPAVRSALELEISDDGVGLLSKGSQGLGLLSMQARAAEVGGSCTIQPAATGGVCVLARLPILVVQP